MSEKSFQIKVTEEYAGWRLDKFLAEKQVDYSRSLWQKMIREGQVNCNGRIVSSVSHKIASGENIESKILPEPKENPLPLPEDIPLKVLFEDEYLLVIDKPEGMVVHPGDGSEHGTVVNALLQKFAHFADAFEDKYRPGIVHRLDKDTSGLLLIAKNQEGLERLQRMFKNREIHKTYLAVIHGHPKKHADTITEAISRHPVNRKKMACIEDGKNAVTHFSVIKEGYVDNQPIAFLEVKIETGRTHQIRVHLAEIHLPLIGDKLYGGSRRNPQAPRQMLHAWELEFKHPFNGRKHKFSSQIPADIQALVDRLK